MIEKKVLILCTGNSARSQMAEGILRHLRPDFDVKSAGTAPSRVREEAIEVMEEIGIPIADHWPKSVDEFTDQAFDCVITVCDNARESCPVFPGETKLIHWSFDDPAVVEGTHEERRAAFRRVRDEISRRLVAFSNG